MSKKSSVNKPKKSRRRLKRSIRRSLAAVLMITAIGIAAVPVPENLATVQNLQAKADDVDSDPHDMSKYGYEENSNNVTFLPASQFKADCYIDTPTSALNKAKTNDIDEDGTKKDEPNYFASYKIVDDFYDVNQDVRASLNWEFMYYVATVPAGKSSATGGVIFRYNDAYSAIDIKLDSFPVTEYYIIKKDQFNDFFSKGKLDDFPTSLDPTKEIQYDYWDYLSEKSGSTLEDIYYSKENNINIARFIENYALAKSSYEDKKKELEKYDVYYKWTHDTRDEAEKLADGMTKPGDDYPTAEPKLAFRPVDKMSEEDKSRYFCEFSANSDIKGGELREVHDDRQPSEGTATAGSGTVFVVYKDGKYVPKTISGRSIVAIGDGAFKGVSNVTSMTIPDKILYIGDEAFANATLMSEIHIMNAHVIGNRAFKGCTSLATVELGKGTSKIGTECFTNTAISTIEFPQTTELIGYGAFSSCINLTTVLMNRINVGGYGCEIQDYAFYNCNKLMKIEMDNATIGSIGKGAFATPIGGVLESVVLPQNDMMKRADSLGDYMFAGNTALKSVVFPRSYGVEKWGDKDVIPPAMFHGCINLSYVEFPAKNPSPMYACGYAKFDSNLLFADVADENFYVRGPELNGTGTVAASPRRCTWTAKTAVSNVVPYLYVDKNGTEYYEMSDGEYLKCVRKDPEGNTGVLTKCTLIPGNKIPSTPNINLPIEAFVGNIKITGIEEGCFSDNNLNQNVVSLNIHDNSINAIANGVFKDWANLKSVRIGNSVNSIGDEAFAGCKKLADVTFSSPQIGYDNFTIGRDAFKTGSDKLTFHGDIVEGYAPFDWAMNPDNIIKEPEKIRVCYKSLAPSYLTVMYNPHTEYVTLLDYPKYNQVSSILDDVYDMKIKEVQSDNKDNWVGKYVNSYESLREYELYRDYNSEKYDTYRKVFASEWQKIAGEKVPDNAAMKALYESDKYGPWINPEFCAAWSDSLDPPPDNNTSSNILTDWLFEPIVAYAAEVNPIPYFEYGEDPLTHRGGNHYDVINNQEMSGLWRSTTGEEGTLIEATEKIVVPTGVQSIDVQGFINNKTATGETSTNKIFDNKYNAQFYLYGYPYEGCWDHETENMYLVDGYKLSGDTDALSSEAGLFSGWYDDKASDEQFKRGNDRVREITLTNVKYLPDYAFDSCERLTTVILGPDCADIGTAPFRGCTALQTVGNNEHYITDNGIVYSVNPDGSYTIEECLPTRGMPGKPGEAEVSLRTDANLAKVSSIKAGAFEDCDKVSLVDLTNTGGLTSIPKNCFRGCDGLNRLHLPAAINSIEEGAFAETTGFTELVIPGKEVFIAGGAFTPRGDKDATTTFYTSEDSSAKRYVDEYGMRYKLLWEKKDNWRVLFLDADLNQIGDAQTVVDGETAVIPPDPEKEGWIFAGWRGTNNADPGKPIKEDTTFVAIGYSTSNMIDGKFVVEFRDQLDNGKVFNTQLVAPGGSAVEPQPPVHAGYVFDTYGGDAYTNIQKATTVIAMYKNEAGNGKYIVEFMDQIDGKIFNTQEVEPGGSAIAPQAPIHEGYTFVQYGGDPITNVQKNSIVLAMYSGGTGSGGNAGTTSSGTTVTSTTSTTSTTSNSVSGNSTSSTSTGAEVVGKYTVTVINGSGSGTYDVGSTVIIAANTPATGKVFSKWTTESVGVTLASVSLSATTFVMPANNVTITANYVTGSSTALTGTSTNGNTGNNNGNNNGNNGGTRVDITKPGISNKDLATAKVNGSTDNFVVKISETPEATQAVMNALMNKYGNLDSVLYYAMDVSLYDSTGTVPISDTTGLTVDITIPIPDALTVFGGNNMAGAVVADQLEDLSERFSTINGVPCISFTATHFSPYTVYVNTQQLSDGALDITPKTGDPIHPKWFLSLGLACLSIILFMKKDRKPVKVKAA